MQSLRLSSTKALHSDLDVATLRPANDNVPEEKESRTSILLGRVLIVFAVMGVAVVTFVWVGWFGRMAWKALMWAIG
ncbi:hypothetical protein [Bosea lathyri]|uniref:Uncharacterized protein n=1 Tax=Bosea lathyri TaxID=1036778 RepID=A0A1H6BJU2_9HYPH|nr:hypothetical protein [Bosea lathyri]SEG60627.1 hypothetical protein SAMN04488115_107267 [Bosea lathyri]